MARKKIEAYCVVDFGWSWQRPVTAFTDRYKALVCKHIREQRRIDPNDGVFCPADYAGSYVQRIEVVIDEE